MFEWLLIIIADSNRCDRKISTLFRQFQSASRWGRMAGGDMMNDCLIYVNVCKTHSSTFISTYISFRFECVFNVLRSTLFKCKLHIYGYTPILVCVCVCLKNKYAASECIPIHHCHTHNGRKGFFTYSARHALSLKPHPNAECFVCQTKQIT